MSKIDKAQTVMNWIAGAAGLYFVSIAIAGAVKRKRENGTQGVGSTPKYSKRQLDTYLDCRKIVEMQANYDIQLGGYVLTSCQDNTGEWRDFYLSKKNLADLFRYCRWRMIPIAIWDGKQWQCWNCDPNDFV